MLALTCQIALGDYQLDFCNEITVDTSYTTLTNTATITLPRSVLFEGEPVALGSGRLLKRGTLVTIRTGYDGQLKDLFTGFITQISPGTPVKIGLEDAMWNLKQNTNSFSAKQATLSELLAAVVPIAYESIEADLGTFRVERASTSQVLRKLYDDFNFRSFIRGGKLYVGLSYWEELQQEHTLALERNVISHDLQYQEADDVRVKVKAISNLPDGNTLEAEVGDPDGTERTLNYYNVEAVDELRARATEELDRIKFTGLRGSLTCFGQPLVNHGDVVGLQDQSGQYEGKYIAESISVRFGTGGYRQKITLGQKI